MFEAFASLAAIDFQYVLVIGGIIVFALFAMLVVVALVHYGALWLQAYMSGADVSAISLIGMTLCQVKPRMIVTAKVAVCPRQVGTSRLTGMPEELIIDFRLDRGEFKPIREDVMSEKKPTPIIVERNSSICPVCGKRSYSRGGIHPQCAMIQADAPRNLRLAAEKKAKAKERRRTLA